MSDNPTNKLPHYRHAKARQPHACGDCRGRIEPGEMYHSWSQQICRRWGSSKRCEDCERLAGDLMMDSPEMPVASVGHLRQAVIESADRDVLAKWIGILRRRKLPAELIQQYLEILTQWQG